jgi:hypothetical protein
MNTLEQSINQSINSHTLLYPALLMLSFFLYSFILSFFSIVTFLGWTRLHATWIKREVVATKKYTGYLHYRSIFYAHHRIPNKHMTINFDTIRYGSTFICWRHYMTRFGLWIFMSKITHDFWLCRVLGENYSNM